MQEKQEMQVQPLRWEDPLEEEMAAHPVFLPGEPHRQGAYHATVHGVAESDAIEHTLLIYKTGSLVWVFVLWLVFILQQLLSSVKDEHM